MLSHLPLLELASNRQILPLPPPPRWLTTLMLSKEWDVYWVLILNFKNDLIS